MEVPGAEDDIGGREGRERCTIPSLGGRLADRVCKISKKALMDDTGGVLGLFLKMKSLTRAVSKRMTREKK